MSSEEVSTAPPAPLSAEHQAAIARAFPEELFKSEHYDVTPTQEDPECKVRIHYRIHRAPGSGSHAQKQKRGAILFIHGHPQNHLIWHRVAPVLARRNAEANESDVLWDLVLPDMRGRGDSSCPIVPASAYESDDAQSRAQRARYSKLSVARDFLELMGTHLGYATFHAVGHDRGGRVLHRLLADAPKGVVQQAIILDIAPTLDMYNTTNQLFAQAYWHWFFLVQKQPLPEKFISNDPQVYLDALVKRFPTSSPQAAQKEKGDDEATFPPWILASYHQGLSTYALAHGCIECYRASAPGGVDLTQDADDRKAIAQGAREKIATPTRVIWGKHGLIEKAYGGGLHYWRETVAHVEGRSADCGHYVPEEAPQEILKEIDSFFTI